MDWQTDGNVCFNEHSDELVEMPLWPFEGCRVYVYKNSLKCLVVFLECSHPVFEIDIHSVQGTHTYMQTFVWKPTQAFVTLSLPCMYFFKKVMAMMMMMMTAILNNLHLWKEALLNWVSHLGVSAMRLYCIFEFIYNFVFITLLQIKHIIRHMP